MFLKSSTNAKDRGTIQSLLNDSKAISIGNKLPNFEITDFNKTKHNIHKLTKRKNSFLLFWNPEYVSKSYISSRLRYLSNNYPNITFYVIKTDGSDSEKIENLDIKNQILEIKKVKKQKLLVGAAVGAGPNEFKRAEAIVKEGVDLIVVDTAHGHTKKVGEIIKFIKRVKKNKQITLNFIRKNIKLGKKIFIYGASTKGNTLLQYYGLTRKEIPFAAERSKTKWGKYTIGSGIKIISEDKARKLNPDYFFVMPYGFIDEFVKREKKWLKSGGKFILPYPNFKVL